MACEVTDTRLVAFELAGLPPAERREVEAHLLECRSCLQGYLELKRSLDESRTNEVAPGRGVRQALRASFLEAHRRVMQAPRPFLGYAAAGVAAAALVAFGLWLPRHASGHRPHPVPPSSHPSGLLIDTASPAAQTLHTL